MTQKKCIYCDTVYEIDAEECPLCGGKTADIIETPTEENIIAAPEPVVPAPAPARVKPAPVKKQPEPEPEEEDDDGPNPVPRWMTILISAVLALALLVGLAFIGYSLGLFDRKDPDADQQLQLPLDDEKDQNQNNQTPDQSVTPDDTQQPDDTQNPDDQTQPDTQPDDTQNPDDTQQPDDQDPPVDPDDNPDDEQTPPDDEDKVPDDEEEKDLSCTGIKLNMSDVTLFSKGEQFTLRASVEPAGCTDEVIWTSSDERYAIVSRQGLVTAVNGKGNDSITITATCGAMSASCIVRLNFAEVEDNSTAEGGDNNTSAGNYSLNITDFTLQYNGEQVEVEVKDANLMTDTFVWSIDDPDIAEIIPAKDTCLVIAKLSGTTTLRVKINGGTELTCIVRSSKAVGNGAETTE